MFEKHCDNYQEKQVRWPLIVVGFTIIARCSLASLAVRADDIEMVDASEPENQSKVPSLFNYKEYLDRYHKFSVSALWSHKHASAKLLVRTKLFIARTLTIFKHNALYATQRVSYYLKQNKFTDMPTEAIQKLLVSDKIELNPVSEALLTPNMPADEYMAQLEADPMDIDGGEDLDDEHNKNYGDFSQASLADLDASSVASKMKASDRLDFFTDQTKVSGLGSGFDLDNSLRSINLEPALAKVSLEISSHSWKPAESEIIEEDGRNADMSSRVAHSSMVKPNNPHYDASLLPSQGILSGLTNFIGSGIGDEDDTIEDCEDDLKDSNESYIYSIAGKIRSFLNAIGVGPNADREDDHQDDLEIPQVAPEQNAKKKKMAPEAGEIVYDVDWRVTGCISPVKDQKECNACYIFAVMDMLEFSYCQQKKTSTQFSPQYLLDCGSKTNLGGCNSGKLADVGRFIMTYGIHLDAAYPYKAKEDKCPFDQTNDREQKSFPLKPLVNAWQRFDTIRAWYFWYSRKPLVVGINMPSDFLAYGGGVHHGQDCVPKMAHTMFLVGSGQQDGNPFWLLKNSFVPEWGESGYFRLSKRAKLNCFNSALVINADFSTEADEIVRRYKDSDEMFCREHTAGSIWSFKQKKG